MANINFNSIKIGLASPTKIREWSFGAVEKPETINYRSLKPEPGGLFCEKIFGPVKDYQCSCGKYKNAKTNEKIICDKCGVEVTKKKVRRERMGHIDLACPVTHIWYWKSLPSKMAIALDMPPKSLENVIYFAENVVLDPGSTPLKKGQVLTDSEYKEYRDKYENDFRVGMGAEAIKELLEAIDINALSKELRTKLEEKGTKMNTQLKVKLIKRLEIIESFRVSGNKLEWMVLDVLPVLPPDIRPMTQLDGGRFASSDLNELYRRVISRNNRLKKLLEIRTPEIVVRNEKRMLQEAVDALIDNGKRGKPVTGPSNRPLKSLSEMLRGKQGRFRQNLLGKRVDYSGRSVIVVGPDLKIYQCGLPREMALELFKPFVVKRLVEMQKSTNVREAQKKIDRTEPEVWDALENVIKEHPVLLNRAPTLHRLSIQAFEPVLVDGRAIKLHPLVCTAFNADFDGDQMPVHVPLSAEAQAEARFLMLSANNLLKPMDGRAVAVPSQDMVLGSYYLTMDKFGEPGDNPPPANENEPDRRTVFRDIDEAILAYENGQLGLHSRIRIIRKGKFNGEMKTQYVPTTLGRLIFNTAIPQDLGFQDRKKEEKFLLDEIDHVLTKKDLGKIVDRCIKYYGAATTSKVLDSIKELGYKYSTRASFSISVYDMTIPKEKKSLIKAAEAGVEQIYNLHQEGLLSEEERYNQVIKLWNKTTDDVTAALKAGFDEFNPIKIMSDSGARGSIAQMRQLAGMRGLMFATNGRTMEIPIKSNFREGLTILEYFSGARGSRKSLSDTALRTADSGYLTRRLVDVSQEVIVKEDDCHTTKGAWVSAIVENGREIEPLSDRLLGRFTANCDDGDVKDANGNIIVPRNTMITEEHINAITAAGVEAVYIRTIYNCRAKHGVCAHCYGADLSAGNKLVNIGEAVGIIAAQSIGEPGTQLTMRTFHSGGVAGSDITQGLPRVEEIFEARTPKKTAIMAEKAGRVYVTLGENNVHELTIVPDDGTENVSIIVPYGTRLSIEDGQHVNVGDALTEGNKAPADIMRILGLDAVYAYITMETQKVYRSQSCDVNDKHIEIIARQMTRKIRINKTGTTNLLLGSTIDIIEFWEICDALQARIDAGEAGIVLPEGETVLLGITKAALQTASFLSAASFQETTKVLAEAAVKGKVDHLVGLKENVIIGKLIPAGTGMNCYHNIDVEANESADIYDTIEE